MLDFEFVHLSPDQPLCIEDCISWIGMQGVLCTLADTAIGMRCGATEDTYAGHLQAFIVTETDPGWCYPASLVVG